MTKEEIINKHTSSERRESDFNQSKGYDFKYLNLTSARLAMDEYAKQQSIDFFKWYGVKMASFLEYLTTVKPICRSEEIEEAMSRHEGATFEQLYAQFIEQQQSHG